MADKMLIDASHAEETRVVVVRGNRIEEFDFESQHKKQIRGNIYLAKVTRVEPSLQAAFVDYGGNRHGFLAFAEIHPDYYQIPLADRQALLRAEAEQHRRDDDNEPVETAGDSASDLAAQDQPDAAFNFPMEEELVPQPSKAKKPRGRGRAAPKADKVEAKAEAADVEGEAATDGEETSEGKLDNGDMAAMVEVDMISEDVSHDRKRRRDEDDDDDDDGEKEVIESVGAEDAMEEVPDRAQHRPRKQYRIQEVIKRRQILLVQVAKEERGNKGAALTTYLSLAGRYSVLMPNTARGGGISRKITNLQDRKRLKEIARSLEVPQGMGVILRTAGANRTKVEIKRDFEYLMRLWENVRTLTLSSSAPCLVYEEGSLIKRSIRDLYNKDISEIVVAGEEGYREAKDFMKMLMPSHAKVVQPYRDLHPIFSRAGIEAQLDRMLQPQVTLKSGGYIIINQTEALVAIDVNSGRSTREHSIEDTALQTNLEAAEEVARQLRLRDLAGLVVIDFIDMEEKRNNRHVEKRLKDHLKNDRARIQVGRISHFGLMEMSRQRIRASVLESTMQLCTHCGGTGHVRSQSSVALHVLRGIEEFLLKANTHNITVHTTQDTALYLLNQKRETITDYERRFGVSIIIDADPSITTQHFAIERRDAVENPIKIEQMITYAAIDDDDDDIAIIEEDNEDEIVVSSEAPEDVAAKAEDPRKRKRRRRRRGGKPGANGGEFAASADDADNGDEDDDESGDEDAAGADASDPSVTSEQALSNDENNKRKRRRRGKRGGKKNRTPEEMAADALNTESTDGVQASQEDEAEAENDEVEAAVEVQAVEAETVAPPEAVEVEVAPKPRRTRKAKAVEAADGAAIAEVAEKPAKATRTRKPAKTAKAEKPVAAVEEPETAAEEIAPVTAAEEVAVEPVVVATEIPEATPVAAEPARANRGEAAISNPDPVVTSSAPKAAEKETKPKKGGWWQKRGFL